MDYIYLIPYKIRQNHALIFLRGCRDNLGGSNSKPNERAFKFLMGKDAKDSEVNKVGDFNIAKNAIDAPKRTYKIATKGVPVQCVKNVRIMEVVPPNKAIAVE